jgi:hypothetical protein
MFEADLYDWNLFENSVAERSRLKGFIGEGDAYAVWIC